jgi:TPR repeat protein
MSRKLTFIGLGLVVLASIIGIWRLNAFRAQSPGVAAKIAPGSVAPQHTNPDSRVTQSQPVPTVISREARRKERDYRQLVDLLLPMANAGSAEAQFEVASALHYCDKNSHLLISRAGVLRTPEEIHELYTKLPENTQSLVEQAYQRCRSFAGDLNSLKASSEWLDRAAKAGYPPAIFMKADLMMQIHLMDGGSAPLQQARQLAITASTSADPAILFGMADFVDGTSKTREQAGQLMSAWWLLGCESGYDCSAESDAMRGMCTVDPQCANKTTVVEEIQRTNGAHFGDVQQLAEQIKDAVNSRDPEEIKKYL